MYPLKTDGKATSTLEDFSIQATIKSQHSIQNVYSPTHAITLNRANDHEVTLTFERNQGLLDKDFQFFYATGDKDIGCTTLIHRPISREKGYVLLLISPRMELPKDQTIARDMVLVLDTSGSMRGPKIDQAKRALKYCLSNLGPKDRFALMNFATTINKYKDALVEGDTELVEQARKWVDNLEATGGTAINDALAAALEMRSSDASRTFTIVFFTDGQPTIGETNPERILRNVTGRNTANTRIFTFGVGDDVNATLLDQLAEETRAVSTYVRPAEDIEAKVSSLYGKISHPVLANVKLSTGNDVRLDEVYPAQLPDLFRGGQIVVLGRYSGHGHAAVTLSGTVGMEHKEVVYEVNFADKTAEDKGFVEQLWARRKVGYLLDQIRANGEKKELVEETVALAKKYGIATPYTSYLIVPDAPIPVAGRFGASPIRGQLIGGNVRSNHCIWRRHRWNGGGITGLRGPPGRHEAFSRLRKQRKASRAIWPQIATSWRASASIMLKSDMAKSRLPSGAATGREDRFVDAMNEAGEKKAAYAQAKIAFAQRRQEEVQTGKLGVDLSIDANNLRNQSRLTQTAQQNVAGRNCIEYGGLWIDEDFDAKMPAVIVKAMSPAYFRLLERQPQLKEVFKLGNQLVWVTPNRSALVIDTNDGKEKLNDAEIDRLFVAKQ